MTLQILSALTGTMSFFFFQAEDGIRDDLVTGVQTCALPISIEDLAPGAKIRRHSGSAAAGARSSMAWLSRRVVGKRSEERRVGKECRCGWGPYRESKKQ